jgi:hypothetical protein
MGKAERLGGCEVDDQLEFGRRLCCARMSAGRKTMALEMKEEQRQGYLKDEYLFLQSQYEDYDKRSLAIKGWVSGGALAALALSFSSPSKFAVLLPIMTAVVVGSIWYLEAYWKMFQYALADRIRIIEAYFRSDPDILIKDLHPFQIYNWWFRTYSEDKPIFPYEERNRPRSHVERMVAVAGQKFVCIPYLPIILLCGLTVAVLAAEATR